MIDVLCLGTPEIAGDAFGPIVGSKLVRRGIDVNVIGTLRDPVVNDNYEERLKEVREGSTLIVVDATLGKPGLVSVTTGPLKPGAGVHLHKDEIGDYAVRCPTGKTTTELMNCTAEYVYTQADRAIYTLMDLINNINNKIYNNNINLTF